MNDWLSQTVVESLGWALVHFLWQGVVIAALLAVGLKLLRRSSSNRRYLAGCLALFILSLSPAITFRCLVRHYELSPDSTRQLISAPAVADSLAPETRLPTKLAFIKKSTSHELNLSQRLTSLLPWVVIGWAIGVLALSCRLLAGWRQIRQLKLKTVATLDETWLGRLAKLGRRMGIDRPVRLVESALVEVPTVIGWLRPIILLPASCLAGLTPAQLESILAHELAHIRRHDYLVNLLQSVVETILFYHPAVWWVSRQMREERENCCDDLAVEICGDRIAYARALATLEELRPALTQFALAAGGAPLLQRIQRLVGQSRKNPNRPGWPMAGIIALLLIALLAMSLRGNRAVAGDDENTATNITGLVITNHAITNKGSAIPGKPIDITGRENIRSKLNQLQIDSVKFDGVTLEEAIADVASMAKSLDPDYGGINFSIERQVGIAQPPGAAQSSNEVVDIAGAKVIINPALNHPRMIDVLDAIVKGADQPIRYTILDYAVVFAYNGQSKRPSGLQTVRQQVDASAFERRQNLLSKLDRIHIDYLSSNTLPLGQVVNDLNTIAKTRDPNHVGIKFYIDTQVSARQGFILGGGSSLNVEVGVADIKVSFPLLKNCSLMEVLKAVVGGAEQPIKYAVHDQAVIFSLRDQVPLEMRTFRMDPAIFRRGLENISGTAPHDVSISGTNQDSELHRLIRKFFASTGVDFTTNNGKIFVFNNRKGVLTVRGTSQDLEKIDDAITRMMAATSDVIKETRTTDAPIIAIPPPAAKAIAKPEINIKVKFVEMDASQSPRGGLNWFFNESGEHVLTNPAPDYKRFINYPGTSNATVTVKFPVTNSIISQFTGILTRKQFETAIAALEQRDGVDEMTAPEVTTETGRQAQIQAVNIITVVNGRNLSLEDKRKGETPFTAQPLPFGPVLDVIPYVTADGKTIEVTLIATVTEFEGYSQGATGKTLTAQPVFSKGVEPLPHVRMRQLTTAADVHDGDTIMLGGVETERLISVTNKTPVLSNIPFLGSLFHSTSFKKTRKNLLVFVTLTLINPDGTLFHESGQTLATPSEIPTLAPVAK